VRGSRSAELVDGPIPDMPRPKISATRTAIAATHNSRLYKTRLMLLDSVHVATIVMFFLICAMAGEIALAGRRPKQ
jgi:hypothetical protein